MVPDFFVALPRFIIIGLSSRPPPKGGSWQASRQVLIFQFSIINLFIVRWSTYSRMMAISQSYDGERMVVRCPSYDNFVLCKITKRLNDLQAFTQSNYVVDFAFLVYYLRSVNGHDHWQLAVSCFHLSTFNYTLHTTH